MGSAFSRRIVASSVKPVETVAVSSQTKKVLSLDDILGQNIRISYTQNETDGVGEDLLNLSCTTQEQLMLVLEYLHEGKKSFKIHSTNAEHKVTVLGTLELPNEDEYEGV